MHRYNYTSDLDWLMKEGPKSVVAQEEFVLDQSSLLTHRYFLLQGWSMFVSIIRLFRMVCLPAIYRHR